MSKQRVGAYIAASAELANVRGTLDAGSLSEDKLEHLESELVRLVHLKRTQYWVVTGRE